MAARSGFLGVAVDQVGAGWRCRDRGDRSSSTPCGTQTGAAMLSISRRAMPAGEIADRLRSRWRKPNSSPPGTCDRDADRLERAEPARHLDQRHARRRHGRRTWLSVAEAVGDRCSQLARRASACAPARRWRGRARRGRRRGSGCASAGRSTRGRPSCRSRVEAPGRAARRAGRSGRARQARRRRRRRRPSPASTGAESKAGHARREAQARAGAGRRSLSRISTTDSSMAARQESHAVTLSSSLRLLLVDRHHAAGWTARDSSPVRIKIVILNDRPMPIRRITGLCDIARCEWRFADWLAAASKSPPRGQWRGPERTARREEALSPRRARHRSRPRSARSMRVPARDMRRHHRSGRRSKAIGRLERRGRRSGSFGHRLGLDRLRASCAAAARSPTAPVLEDRQADDHASCRYGAGSPTTSFGTTICS